MRGTLAALIFALSACGQEQTFNQRYSQSEDAIEERARELDNELDEPATANGSDNESGPEPI